MSFASLNSSEAGNSVINECSAVEHSMFDFWELLHENNFYLGFHQFFYMTDVAQRLQLQYIILTLQYFDLRAVYKSVLRQGGKNLI